MPSWPLRILLGRFVFGVIGIFTIVGIVTPGSGSSAGGRASGRW
ncbi:MAG TPA: hypothetical protein VLU54_07820 [Casimicrobiaceae bacterium]|nr:hypothetical protein [Casimicrobiaceae bacterium]